MSEVGPGIAPSGRAAAEVRPRSLAWSGGDVVALAIALLVALVIRVGRIDALPSADEVWHLALSRGAGSPVGAYAANVVYPAAPPSTSLAGAPPAWRVWTGMDGVLHPPLYVLALRLWRDVFGETDLAAHAMSIAWSMVALGFVFAAARLALGRAAATWATLVMAAAPVQVYFAQEIRGYEQMIALGAIALWQATRIEVLGPTPRRAALLAFTALPLLLTHYFAAGGVLGMAAYATARLRGRPLWGFVGTSAAAGVVYAAGWLPFALRQIASIHTGDAFARVVSFDAGRELAPALAIPIRMLVERTPFAFPSLGMTVAGAAMLAVPWYCVRAVPSLRPWAAWLCGSVFTLVALDAARTTFLVQIVRYAAVASPAVPLVMLGLGRALNLGRATHIAFGAAVAFLLVATPRDGDGPTFIDAPRFGATARWLARASAPGDAILIVAGATGEHTADLIALTLGHEPGLFPRTIVKLDAPPTPEVLRTLPGRAWAVVIYRDDPSVVAALAGLRRAAVNDIPGEGGCDLYDLAAARPDAAKH